MVSQAMSANWRLSDSSKLCRNTDCLKFFGDRGLLCDRVWRRGQAFNSPTMLGMECDKQKLIKYRCEMGIKGK